MGFDENSNYIFSYLISFKNIMQFTENTCIIYIGGTIEEYRIGV